MYKDLSEVLISEDQILEKVKELGKQISLDYKDKNLLLISVLKGSFIFMADLMRAIDVECAVDFMALSSYGSGVKTSGVVKITKDLDMPIENYDVLIVEDILDSGLTLKYTLRLLSKRNPASLKVCTLLDKPARRQADVRADYKGFEIEDKFIVGYGLDYGEKYRNLKDIGVLKSEVYE